MNHLPDPATVCAGSGEQVRDAAPGQSMRCTDVVPEIRPNRITSPVTTGFSPRSRSARAVPVDPADECRRTRARATSSPGTNPSAANSNRLGRATAVGVSCGGANGGRGCCAGGFGGVRRVRRRLKRSRPHERERWKTLEGDFLGSCQQGALPTMPLHSRRGDGVSSESLFPFRKIVSCLLPFHCEI